MAVWVWWEWEPKNGGTAVDYLYVLLEDHTVEDQDDHYWDGSEFKQVFECVSGPYVTGYESEPSEQWRKLYKTRLDYWVGGVAIRHAAWQRLRGPWTEVENHQSWDFEWKTFKRPYQKPFYPTVDEEDLPF